MEKLTIEKIKSKVVAEEVRRIGEKTTVCVFTLENGFEVVGSSACVDPNDYDFDIGMKYARENAYQKVWELEAYLLQENKFKNSKGLLINMDEKELRFDFNEWKRMFQFMNKIENKAPDVYDFRVEKKRNDFDVIKKFK
jgi:hypothetical protein